MPSVTHSTRVGSVTGLILGTFTNYVVEMVNKAGAAKDMHIRAKFFEEHL